MKLYDFAAYVRRRDEKKAQQAVAEALEHIDQPGSVLVLKREVSTWFKLHQDIITHIEKAA
jgi:hypothetical protein